MKICPTKWEIYTDDLSELIAEFEAIDEDAIIVSIKNKVMDPSDLIQLSQCLEKAYKQYNEPNKEN